jgi:hypothetical protein
MPYQYNYRLKTGEVGTNNENIANALYNINRIETLVPYQFSNGKSQMEDKAKLFSMVVDANVNIYKFLEIFRDRADSGAAKKVMTAFDECINMIESAMDSDNAVLNVEWLGFEVVYQHLLGIVPTILELDKSKDGV